MINKGRKEGPMIQMGDLVLIAYGNEIGGSGQRSSKSTIGLVL